MSNEITLPLGASAEPDTCGSCYFFKRTMDMGSCNASRGRCRFTLPPTMRIMFTPKPYEEGDEDRVYVEDTDRCDLQRPDGNIYIVQRKIVIR